MNLGTPHLSFPAKSGIFGLRLLSRVFLGKFFPAVALFLFFIFASEDYLGRALQICASSFLYVQN